MIYIRDKYKSTLPDWYSIKNTLSGTSETLFTLSYNDFQIFKQNKPNMSSLTEEQKAHMLCALSDLAIAGIGKTSEYSMIKSAFDTNSAKFTEDFNIIMDALEKSTEQLFVDLSNLANKFNVFNQSVKIVEISKLKDINIPTEFTTTEAIKTEISRIINNYFAFLNIPIIDKYSVQYDFYDITKADASADAFIDDIKTIVFTEDNDSTLYQSFIDVKYDSNGNCLRKVMGLTENTIYTAVHNVYSYLINLKNALDDVKKFEDRMAKLNKAKVALNNYEVSWNAIHVTSKKLGPYEGHIPTNDSVLSELNTIYTKFADYNDLVTSVANKEGTSGFLGDDTIRPDLKAAEKEFKDFYLKVKNAILGCNLVNYVNTVAYLSGVFDKHIFDIRLSVPALANQPDEKAAFMNASADQLAEYKGKLTQADSSIINIAKDPVEIPDDSYSKKNIYDPSLNNETWLNGDNSILDASYRLNNFELSTVNSYYTFFKNNLNNEETAINDEISDDSTLKSLLRIANSVDVSQHDYSRLNLDDYKNGFENDTTNWDDIINLNVVNDQISTIKTNFFDQYTDDNNLEFNSQLKNLIEHYNVDIIKTTIQNDPYTGSEFTDAVILGNMIIDIRKKINTLNTWIKNWNQDKTNLSEGGSVYQAIHDTNNTNYISDHAPDLTSSNVYDPKGVVPLYSDIQFVQTADKLPGELLSIQWYNKYKYKDRSKDKIIYDNMQKIRTADESADITNSITKTLASDNPFTLSSLNIVNSKANDLFTDLFTKNSGGSDEASSLANQMSTNTPDNDAEQAARTLMTNFINNVLLTIVPDANSDVNNYDLTNLKSKLLNKVSKAIENETVLHDTLISTDSHYDLADDISNLKDMFGITTTTLGTDYRQNSDGTVFNTNYYLPRILDPYENINDSTNICKYLAYKTPLTLGYGAYKIWLTKVTNSLHKLVRTTLPIHYQYDKANNKELFVTADSTVDYNSDTAILFGGVSALYALATPNVKFMKYNLDTGAILTVPETYDAEHTVPFDNTAASHDNPAVAAASVPNITDYMYRYYLGYYNRLMEQHNKNRVVDSFLKLTIPDQSSSDYMKVLEDMKLVLDRYILGNTNEEGKLKLAGNISAEAHSSLIIQWINSVASYRIYDININKSIENDSIFNQTSLSEYINAIDINDNKDLVNTPVQYIIGHDNDTIVNPISGEILEVPTQVSSDHRLNIVYGTKYVPYTFNPAYIVDATISDENDNARQVVIFSQIQLDKNNPEAIKRRELLQSAITKQDQINKLILDYKSKHADDGGTVDHNTVTAT